MRKALFAAVLAAVPTTAYAQSTQDGWGVMFRQDTFDRTVFPMAIMSETGDGIMKSNLVVACGPNSELRVAFQARSMMSFQDMEPVTFRIAEGSREVAFTRTELPNLGAQRAASAADSDAVLQAFTSAAEQPVPFRFGENQGSFPSIGAGKVFDIVRSNCTE